LRALWKIEEGTVSKVRETVKEGGRSLAYTTVMTLLERLVKRNAASRRKHGRAYVYQAKITQERLQEAAVKDLVETLFHGSREALRDYLTPSTMEGGL
jgi:predicted transcriptional regulator